MNPKMLEITGAPEWVKSDTYQVTAKAAGDASFALMAGPMMQGLLEDRFALKVHRESKDVAVYFLTVANTGAKLEPTKAGSCLPLDVDHPPAAPGPGQPRPTFCGNGSVTNKGSDVTISQHGMSMQLLAGGLSNFAGRAIVDKTDLAGLYEIHLEFAPDGVSPGPSVRDGADSALPVESPAPSLFTALQEQLGLKLEPGRGKTELLVIDHVERPSDN
jgi:uncharacterized protein (TIGR03435 family)